MSPGGATILVVDDEPVVLDTVRDGLTAHGYQVLSAASGDEALQASQAHQGSIALALVDVIMPGMSGPEVAQRLHAARPDLKVLFAFQPRHPGPEGPPDPRLPLTVLAPSAATALTLQAARLDHLTTSPRHRQSLRSRRIRRVRARRAFTGGDRG